MARLNFAPRVAGPVAQLCFDGSRRLEGAHLTCLQSKQHNNILRSYYESSESLSDEPYATNPESGAGAGAGAASTRRRFSTGAGPSSTLFFTRGATTTEGAGAFAASARNARTATSSAAFA